MVKVRANDLTGKGVVQKILFASDEVAKGEQLVLISTMSGDIIVDAPCSGRILKVAPPGSTIKSGSVVLTMEEIEDDTTEYRSQAASPQYKSFEFGSKWQPIDDRDYSDEFSKASLVGDELIPQAGDTQLNGDGIPNFSKEQIMHRSSYNNSNNKSSDILGGTLQANYNSVASKQSTFNRDKINSEISERLYNDDDKANNGIVKDDRAVTDPMPSNSVFANMRKDIIGAVKSSKQLYNANNDIKDELRTYNQEYRSAKDEPTSVSSNETNFSNFRDRVNQRLTKLHDDNGFEKLNLKDADKQGAMDFLDEYGRPKTLRNIVTNRLAALRERNLGHKDSVDAIDDDLSYDTSDFIKKDDEGDSAMNNGYANLKKAPRLEEPSDYTNRVFSKLHDDVRRENILRTQNQRELIKKRMEQIASGKIEADDVIGAVSTYKRPSMEDMEEQIKDPDRIPDAIKGKDNMEDYGFANTYVNRESGGYNAQNSNVVSSIKEGFGVNNIGQLNNSKGGLDAAYPATMTPDMNQPLPSVQPATPAAYADRVLPNNDIYRELGLIQEKINQQNEMFKHEALMNEIRKTKEDVAKINNGNSDNSFDKMMQMMMMQSMMNSINMNNANHAMPNPMMENYMNAWMNNQMMNNPMMNNPMMNNPMMNNQPFNTMSNVNGYQQAIGNQQWVNNSNAKPAFKQEPVVANRKDELVLNRFDNAGNVMQIKQPHVLNQMSNNINAIEGKEMREPVKPVRSSTVKSMMLSHNYVPPLTINSEVDMSEIIKMQMRLKNARSDMRLRFTTMSFIVKAISMCLNEYPKLNSLFDEKNNQIVIKKSHHIGIATETSEGVIVPVVKFAEKLSLRQIAADLQEKTDRLKVGKLQDYELTGSTISIANYGAVGATQAVPTIMYPNSSMISVGRIIRKPVVTKAEKIAIRSIMSIAVTIDQRIIDANEAGIFLTRLKELLENPEALSL